MRTAALDVGLPAATDANLVSLPISKLTPGVRLRLPIYDDHNVLLLAAGVVLTESLIRKLISRRLTSVRIHRSELERLTHSHFSRVHRTQPTESFEFRRPLVLPEGAVSAQFIEPPVQSLGAVRCSGELLSKTARHGTTKYDPQRIKAVSQQYQRALTEVVGLYDLRRGIRVGEIDTLQGISEECIQNVLTDIDLFVRQGITPEMDKYPPRHGQQTAMLAISMGINLGIDKRDLVDLGVGCLAHDLGMLHLRDDVFEADIELSGLSFLEITKHPGITFDLMRDVEHFAGAPRMVAYQMHERCNGEGYPRGRTDAQIHPLAKIAAVADSYTAMISKRPHREGMTPYAAMELMLQGARQGLYDPIAVRALLRTVSLFPIGSGVELSDGRIGRVIRACGDLYTRPILEAWNANDPLGLPEVVDLTARTELQVVRALTPADLEQNAPPVVAAVTSNEEAA